MPYGFKYSLIKFHDISALQVMISSFPAHKNAPLIISKAGILTQHQVRHHLAKILAMLRLDNRMYSFHMFRQ